MKSCAYCGRQNDDDATNCRECGTNEFDVPVERKNSEIPLTGKNSLMTAHYDPLVWCGVCFLVAVMGYWIPCWAPQKDDPDSRIGIIVIYTGPFVIAAGVRSIFACRRLYIETKTSDGQSNPIRVLGLVLTVGTVLPAAWLMFLFVSIILLH